MHRVALTIAPDHPAFAGHFPGRPLLPGVALLAEVLEVVLADPAFAALVGAAPRIGAAKFLAPVRPGAQLTIEISGNGNGNGNGRGLRFDVRFDVRLDVGASERLAASGHFDAAGTG